jgi:error-prone DNA polymerase
MLKEETQELEKSSDSIVFPATSAAASASPLSPMTADERLIADYRGTGLTVGPHPMAYRRAQIKAQGIRAACELRDLPDGARVRIAGAVIARQRPGTAKGFVFLSLEDETGIANAILTPQIFRANRLVVVEQQFLVIEGQLQNQEGAISVKVEKVWPLSIARVDAQSHDFH